MSERSAEAGAAVERAAAALATVVGRTAPAAARAWFDDAVAACRAGADKRALQRAYASAGRRLGHAESAPTADELRSFESAGLAGVATWDLATTARVALLHAAIGAVPTGGQVALADEIFRTGDNDERVALLVALAVLPEPARYLGIAVEACRTNVQTVFEAIACENRYAELHFPDDSFNQMVLKGIFLGIAVERICGLGRRNNPSLVRMAQDYASELRAAGRSVPAAIAVITGRRDSGAV